MRHKFIDRVMQRAEHAKTDSDFTYFFSLLILGEALFKCCVLTLAAAIRDDVDRDRNRYRIEHTLARADGLGDWSRMLEDVLVGPASQYLASEAYALQAEFTRAARPGEWQHEAVVDLKRAADQLGIATEEIPTKTDFRRWFRIFTEIRNGTRAHGATLPVIAASSIQNLEKSIDVAYENLSLFSLPWAYLYQNLSGTYRVSPLTDNAAPFEPLKKPQNGASLSNGVYIYLDRPRLVPLIESDPDLQDFFVANGKFSKSKYECLSYIILNR